MTGTTLSPRLPLDLEYTIFLFAFQTDPREARRLSLVAKRVFGWMIPHVSRVVKLSEVVSFPVDFNEATYKKYGHHVRHLLLKSPRLREHLHLFPNVVNLAFWVPYDPIYLPRLLELPLTHISTTPSLGLLLGPMRQTPELGVCVAKIV
ncbi:hypothetical protein BDN72DRAFT_893654 [Pluteus cervinus]|uniref:Uncharacterized protein n=1 Tax=Pluteus cervinus TaxID=181527 RepID=A0ACD3B6E5_9AGAR|nr:hypothetical protein BDN72DRAFT_893654 [Pluteus cervinus]